MFFCYNDDMNITSATLALITNDPAKYPKTTSSEYVFLGRSNVGKSSLINALTKEKKLAYTSGHPGKTQALHFYLINERCFFVDVPGYGYAKVSQAKRAAFGTMIETYLTTREQLKRAFVLVDARHKPSPEDTMMVEYLQHYSIPFSIIVTKIDKLGSTIRHRHFKTIAEHFQVDVEQLLPTSAEERIGFGAIEALLMDCAR